MFAIISFNLNLNLIQLFTIAMLETINDFTRSLGSVWGIVSILVVCAPAALAVHEFTAYRMNQYTLSGSDYGCKSNMVS